LTDGHRYWCEGYNYGENRQSFPHHAKIVPQTVDFKLGHYQNVRHSKRAPARD
jgi:hypothetical protein